MILYRSSLTNYYHPVLVVVVSTYICSCCKRWVLLYVPVCTSMYCVHVHVYLSLVHE